MKINNSDLCAITDIYHEQQKKKNHYFNTFFDLSEISHEKLQEFFEIRYENCSP